MESRSYTVLKRGNRGYEPVKFDKITERIMRLCNGLSTVVDPCRIAKDTISGLVDRMTTEQLDLLSADSSESLKLVHPDYSTLAARILVSNLHKTTSTSFSYCMEEIQSSIGVFSDRHMEFIRAHATELDSMIDHNRDYMFEYFGLRTLENAYLHKKKGGSRVCDRPQYMFMRVAIAVNIGYGNDAEVLARIADVYNALSQMLFIHATPTLFNACGKSQQMSSCFLLGTEDSIGGIMHTLTSASLISKWAGGIGIHMHNIRCRNSHIRGTNGKSSGLPRQLKIYNEAARCWDQGGKRPGAIAIYLEPWQGDILQVLEMKLNQGAETERARDLFYAMWIPDLFMIRYNEEMNRKTGQPVVWSLFSEDTSPGLSSVYDGMHVCARCGWCDNADYEKLMGDPRIPASVIPASAIPDCSHEYEQRDVFTNLYTTYEKEGRAVGQVNPRDIVTAIGVMQRESGTPYLCFKDHVNRMSNQSNIGTVKSSNLCVTPDTYVLTDRGQYMIRDLADTPVNVWNGEGFSKTTPRKTGEMQNILTVRLSSGATVKCTAYHKFYVYQGDRVERKAASDLRYGDVLIKYSLPVVYDGEDFPHAYTRGAQCAQYASESEKQCTRRPLVGTCYCADHIGTEGDSELVTTQCLGVDPAPIAEIPMYAALGDRVAWFTGYCDTIGQIDTRGLVCETRNRHFQQQVRLMLQTMGVDSAVDDQRLIVNSVGLDKLGQLGFTTDHIKKVSTPVYSEILNTVTSIDYGGVSDTYCFTEKHRGMGMFNGVLTGNCSEIMEWSSSTSYASCTLASINLKRFLVKREAKYEFDYNALHDTVRMITRNLDRVIDQNSYPVPECESNARDYRPIGIGVQALADVFAIMRIPFVSAEAAKIDLEIFETIYHAMLTESNALARELGSYAAFQGSPASRGKLHPDLWMKNNARMKNEFAGFDPRSRYDWAALSREISTTGLRNSLGCACMPTVSTSQSLGNNESFEPYSSNAYVKTTLGGKFTVTNTHMIRHLIELGLWNERVKNRLIVDGSLAGISEIPEKIREIYKTVWEVKQIELMRRAALRGAFVDQSQSLNIYLADNSDRFLRGTLSAAWGLGLKTGAYYVRTRPASRALRNNISVVAEETEEEACPIGCTSCSS